MTLRVSFSDFVDLQSRLVLLPRIEEEGVGAVVASYTPVTVGNVNFQEEKKAEEDELFSDDGVSVDEQMDEQSLSSHNDQLTAPTKSEKPEVHVGGVNADDSVTQEDLMTKALVCIEGLEEATDLLLMDFEQILATIREVKTPIVLRFDAPQAVGEGEANDDVDGVIESSDAEQQIIVEEETPQNLDQQQTTSLNAWSSWGKSIAATAASSAKVYASATATAVAKAADEARAARLAKAAAAAAASAAPPVPEPVPPQKCCMFLQMVSGGFMPLMQSNCPKVTTSSVVIVRLASGEACPSRNHEFQWYHSCAAAKASDSMSNASVASSSDSGDGIDEEKSWRILNGATYAAYQPNATDIGRRLRCVVSIDDGSNDEGGDSSVCDETIICESITPIAADKSMFNAARHALSRGAQFSNLAGRGPAEGRSFGVHIEIALSTEDKLITSATTIQQSYGQTLEPLHTGLIHQASAIADPSNPKQFDLIFPAGLPTEATMVSALSQKGRFQLSTPNRVTRETLLLALGIANYSGMPADLTDTTLLFPDITEHCDSAVEGDEVTPMKQTIRQRDVAGLFTPDESVEPVSCNDTEASTRLRDLEIEVRKMQSMLSHKDKVIIDLQRQLVQSDSRMQKTERDLSGCQRKLEKAKDEVKEIGRKLRLAEKRSESEDVIMTRLKKDHELHVSSLEQRIVIQSEKIAEIEKNAKSLYNEKAILSAAVDARDSKLEKMKDLQIALDTLSTKAAKGDSLRSEMSDMSKRYELLCRDLEKVAASETECKEQLETLVSTMEELYQKMDSERTRRKQCEKELESVKRTTQKLTSERNSFKQKAESLTKEVARLCKGGRTLGDIERILIDENSRRTEIDVLRSQKKQALEELHQYRSAYEKQLIAQLKLGVDGAAVQALEQKAELERVVADLTEYVSAKEMQLETMRQVNEALTNEMKQLAKASMSKNDI